MSTVEEARAALDSLRSQLLAAEPDVLRSCEEWAELLGVENDVYLRAALDGFVTDGRFHSEQRGKKKNQITVFERLSAVDQPAPDPNEYFADGEGEEEHDEQLKEERENHPIAINVPTVGPLGSPTRYLRHTLTASEREELRVEREEEDERIEQLTADLESLKKQAKHTANEIEILASKGLEKSKIIRLGWRMQDVPCEERRELDTREGESTNGTLMMVTYRLDTFEPIEWRPLTYAERQGVLFDEAPAKTPSNGVEVRSNGAPKGDVAAVRNLLEGGL